jgi:MATE family multidrug resistance protein
MQIYTIRA